MIRVVRDGTQKPFGMQQRRSDPHQASETAVTYFDCAAVRLSTDCNDFEVAVLASHYSGQVHVWLAREVRSSAEQMSSLSPQNLIHTGGRNRVDVAS